MKLNFYEISYGSLAETKCLYYFAYCKKWLKIDHFDKGKL
jgi:hypothetical protein